MICIHVCKSTWIGHLHIFKCTYQCFCQWGGGGGCAGHPGEFWHFKNVIVKIPTVGQGTAVKIPHFRIRYLARHTCFPMQTYSLYWFKLGKNWDTVYKIPFSMKLDLASPPYLLPGLLMQNRANFQDGGCQNFPTLGVDPSLVLHSVVKVPCVARTPPQGENNDRCINAHINVYKPQKATCMKWKGCAVHKGCSWCTNWCTIYGFTQ